MSFLTLEFVLYTCWLAKTFVGFTSFTSQQYVHSAPLLYMYHIPYDMYIPHPLLYITYPLLYIYPHPLLCMHSTSLTIYTSHIPYYIYTLHIPYYLHIPHPLPYTHSIFLTIYIPYYIHIPHPLPYTHSTSFTIL